MANSTYLDDLHAGYLRTGSMFATIVDSGLSGHDLLRAQVACLAGLATSMQSAGSMRLYGLERDIARPLSHDVAQFLVESNGAHDLDFVPAPRLLEFLADRGRLIVRMLGLPQVMPAYGDLLCFFSNWETVPFSWLARNPTLLYYVNPTKGMDRRAVAELKKFLKSNPDGCVLSITMEAFRNHVAVFPGTEATGHVWDFMTANRYE